MRSLWATLVALCVVAAAPARPSVADGDAHSDARGDRVERAVAVAPTPATAPTAIKLRRRAATPDFGLAPLSAIAPAAFALPPPLAISSAVTGAPSRVPSRPLVDSRSS